MPSNTVSAPLSDAELEAFWADFEHAADGRLSFAELERRLARVHEELCPQPLEHNLNHPTRMMPLSDKPEHWHSSDLHVFLCHLMPGCGGSIDKETFLQSVRQWNIPSQGCVAQDPQEDAAAKQKRLPLRRRWTAWWSIQGPAVVFLGFVVLLQIAFGTWQVVTYAVDRPLARSALGPGVLVAKFSAGVLYPTSFFLVLSMSRWFATWCRRYYWLGLAINWDYSQAFHIYMAIAMTFFSCLHAGGHLAGSFVHASMSANQQSAQALLSVPGGPVRYSDFMWVRLSTCDFRYLTTVCRRARSGWTGIVALSCLLAIGATSSRKLRRWNYQLFQYVHLLMYPMFAVLAMHGTARLRGCNQRKPQALLTFVCSVLPYAWFLARWSSHFGLG